MFRAVLLNFVELFVELDEISIVFCHRIKKEAPKDFFLKTLGVAPAKDLHAFRTEIQV